MLRWLRSVGRGRPAGSVLATNYLYLRQAVGWLGTLLPLILLAANPIALSVEHSSCGWIPGSVSDYYYSPVRNIFVGALCALGLFLIAYVGANLGDRVITDLAGVFALGVALFPATPAVTSPASAACETVSQLSSRQQVIGDIHTVSSVLFFLFLAWMAIRFTTTDSPRPSPQRLRRNRIYWICAIVILASLVAAAVTNFLPASLRPPFPWLFLYEAVGIFAFGLSWFVDGQTLIGALKDPLTEDAGVVPRPVR
jgi:Protein of unknown function (DUF998)